MNFCKAELCRYWTGDGCVCAALDITEEDFDDEPWIGDFWND